MAQAGIHGLAGVAIRKLSIKKEWLFLGIVVGNMAPDLDALAVAYATLTGGDTHGLHRTWSHSIPFMVLVVLLFYVIAAVRKSRRVGNLGLGLGIGMLMHSLVDVVIWFRGVELFWPFYPEINLWGSYTPPAWWLNKFESALEFGMFALFLYILGRFAAKQATDTDFLPKLKIWIRVEMVLFAAFLVLVYIWSGYYIAFGAAYIFSILLAVIVTFRMRKTIESLVQV